VHRNTANKTVCLYVVGSNTLKLHFGYQFINFLKTYFKKVSYIIYTIINASYEEICAKFERKKTQHWFSYFKLLTSTIDLLDIIFFYIFHIGIISLYFVSMKYKLICIFLYFERKSTVNQTRHSLTCLLLFYTHLDGVFVCLFVKMNLQNKLLTLKCF